MKVQLNTEICPIIVPDTYGTDFWANVWDECWDDFKQLMVNKGTQYINDALHETEIFADTNIEDVSELRSPRFYNYRMDWFDFSIEVTDKILEHMRNVDDNFFEYCEKNFSNHPGFHSYYPYEKEKYFKVIAEPKDEDDFALALSEVIMYETSKKISEKYNQEYYEDVWEYASSNGMEVDDEESEEN